MAHGTLPGPWPRPALCTRRLDESDHNVDWIGLYPGHGYQTDALPRHMPSTPRVVAYARGGLGVLLKLGDLEGQEFRARAVSTELAKHFGGIRLHDRLGHVRLRVRPCAASPPGGGCEDSVFSAWLVLALSPFIDAAMREERDLRAWIELGQVTVPRRLTLRFVLYKLAAWARDELTPAPCSTAPSGACPSIHLYLSVVRWSLLNWLHAQVDLGPTC